MEGLSFTCRVPLKKSCQQHTHCHSESAFRAAVTYPGPRAVTRLKRCGPGCLLGGSAAALRLFKQGCKGLRTTTQPAMSCPPEAHSHAATCHTATQLPMSCLLEVTPREAAPRGTAVRAVMACQLCRLCSGVPCAAVNGICITPKEGCALFLRESSSETGPCGTTLHVVTSLPVSCRSSSAVVNSTANGVRITWLDTPCHPRRWALVGQLFVQQRPCQIFANQTKLLVQSMAFASIPHIDLFFQGCHKEG